MYALVRILWAVVIIGFGGVVLTVLGGDDSR